MEIYLLFLFFLIAIILAVFAYLYEARPLLIGSGLILISLALLILMDGYSVEVTTTSIQDVGYIFNATTNQQLPNQINMTSNQLQQKRQDNFSYSIGLILLAFGASAGFLAIKG